MATSTIEKLQSGLDYHLKAYQRYPKAIGYPLNALNWTINIGLALAGIGLIAGGILPALAFSLAYSILEKAQNLLTGGEYKKISDKAADDLFEQRISKLPPEKRAAANTEINKLLSKKSNGFAEIGYFVKAMFKTIFAPLPEGVGAKFGAVLGRIFKSILAPVLLLVSAAIVATQALIAGALGLGVAGLLATKAVTLGVTNLPIYIKDGIDACKKSPAKEAHSNGQESQPTQDIELDGMTAGNGAMRRFLGTAANDTVGEKHSYHHGYARPIFQQLTATGNNGSQPAATPQTGQ